MNKKSMDPEILQELEKLISHYQTTGNANPQVLKYLKGKFEIKDKIPHCHELWVYWDWYIHRIRTPEQEEYIKRLMEEDSFL